MKTPKEFLETKCPLLQQVFADFSSVPNTTQTLVLDAMRDYALHVAAEQDKRTRHAAAELVKKYASVGATDLVHGKIMNLQTQIKEIQPETSHS